MTNEIYAVKGSDLSTLANHIRTKGETNSTLIWPDDFVDAVDAISTGVDVSGVTANASNIQDGYYTFDTNGKLVEGTMPERTLSTTTITTPTQTISIPSGHYSNSYTISIPSSERVNLAAGNLLSSVKVLGITGTIPTRTGSNTTIMTATGSKTVEAGYYPNNFTISIPSSVSTDLAANMISSATVFGVTGTIPVRSTNTGTISTKASPSVTLSSGYYANNITVSLDSSAITDLVSSNLLSSATVLGITGTIQQQTATNRNITAASQTETVAAGYYPSSFTVGIPSSAVTGLDANNMLDTATILGVTGNIHEQTASNQTITAVDDTKTISAGYYPSNFTVSVPSSVGTNLAANMLSSATVFGVTGTIPTVTVPATTLSSEEDSITVPSGYHASSTTITMDTAHIDDLDASNIIDSAEILGVTGSIPTRTTNTATITTKANPSATLSSGYYPNNITVSIDSSAIADVDASKMIDSTTILGVTGSIPTQTVTNQTITSTSDTKTIAAGYYPSSFTVSIPSSATTGLDADKMLTTATILGVTGSIPTQTATNRTITHQSQIETIAAGYYPSSFTVGIPSSAVTGLSADNMLSTATLLGVTGNIPTVSLSKEELTTAADYITIPLGYHPTVKTVTIASSAITDLNSNNILSGKTILGVEGSIPTQSISNSVISTVSQSIPVPSGYYAFDTAISIKSEDQENLIPENIKSGITILGVSGTANVGGTDPILQSIYDGTIKTITSNTKIIRAGLFLSCYQLTSVSFPSCTTIGAQAFQNCTSLTSVSFPSCTIIGTQTFQNCTSLTSVSFPSCTLIGTQAFQSCTTLASISFPSCTLIGGRAFESCTSLTSISFPSCTIIADSAFTYCTSLTSINFPSCTAIGHSAFRSCTSLTSIDFPSCSRVNNYAFAGCTSLTSVNLSACTTINSYAFQNCTSLNSIIILGKNTTTIQGYAFRSCPRLMNLTILYSDGVAPLAAVTAFSSTPISTYTTYTNGVNGSVYVPASLVEAYKSATNWATFSNRITAIPE